MLQNAYFLAKIGADTAENEQHFAEILPIGRRVADRRRPLPDAGRAATSRWTGAPGLGSELKDELNHPQTFERLVLGCIDADFYK